MLMELYQRYNKMIGHIRKGICTKCKKHYNEWTGKEINEKNKCINCILKEYKNKRNEDKKDKI